MPVALEPIRRMRGGAQSCLMRCSDGHFYVVKPSNNLQAPLSGRILANELLGTRIAARIGLPVQPCAVIEVSAELIELSADLRIQFGSKSIPWTPGPHFGSRYPGEPRHTAVYDLLPDEQLCIVENLDDFVGVICADKLACNCDARQAIFLPSSSGQGFRAVFIDHGFWFGAGEWKFSDAPMRGIFPRHRVYQSVRGLASFEPWLERIEKNLTLDALGEIAGEIPLQWHNDPAALEQLIEQVYLRRKEVRRLLLDAARSQRQPFPNFKDGAL